MWGADASERNGGVMRNPMLFYLVFAVCGAVPSASLVCSFAQMPSSASELARQHQEVPEQVIYELYFRRLAFFNDLATKNEKRGVDSSGMRSIIRNELEIDAIQHAFLLETSLDCLKQVAVLDAQATTIIAREHARYPGGLLSNKDDLPKLPPEITNLQARRDSLFLNAKNRLLQKLGAAAFTNIDSHIKMAILPKIRITAP
jgi:hypothetical protein